MQHATESDHVAARVIVMLKGVAAGMNQERRWQFYGELLMAVGEIRHTIGEDVESEAALDRMQRAAVLPARLSDFDVEHVGAIFAGGSSWEFTNYSAHVCRLVKKADAEQREVLRLMYPDHVRAVELWDVSAPGARIWRCPGCGAINASFPDCEAHPATCLGCLLRTEPARVPGAGTTNNPQPPTSKNP